MKLTELGGSWWSESIVIKLPEDSCNKLNDYKKNTTPMVREAKEEKLKRKFITPSTLSGNWWFWPSPISSQLFLGPNYNLAHRITCRDDLPENVIQQHHSHLIRWLEERQQRSEVTYWCTTNEAHWWGCYLPHIIENYVFY